MTEPADPPALRPYVLTAGRVRAADPTISVETQVIARSHHPGGPLSPAGRAIVEACQSPLSVAEISARLGLHLNVTRVLVGDLRDTGAVHIQSTNVHSPEAILRVMRGLRAIR